MIYYHSNTVIWRSAMQYDKHTGARENGGGTQQFGRIAPKNMHEMSESDDHESKFCAFSDKIKKYFMPRRKERPFPLAVLFCTLKILAVIVVMSGCAVFGLMLGIAKAYIDTTPELDVSRLTRSNRTSYIYDNNGELITTFAGMEYRDWVAIEDIPDMLKNALISVEDVRFYRHGGLDFKRLVSAVVNTLRNTDTHGGSTLTQQLIKNKILSNVRSYKRKIQEAYLAVELENTVEKDDILEAYMNDVYLGESNYGMKAAANDYFGKELSELSIRECAMLAGLVQQPSYTNPRANTYERFYEDGTNKMDRTNSRTDTVIWAMYNAGFISSAQRDGALNDTVTILQKSKATSIYDMPYFVEYAVYDVVTCMLEQRELPDTTSNRASIESELRNGGYEIHLTVDPSIQHTLESTIESWDKYPELADPSTAIETVKNSDGSVTTVNQPQAAAVIIDYHTGDIVALVGGRDTPKTKKQWNRAYQSSMPVGSSIKPIAVYAPALDLGASPATIIANIPGEIEGYGGNGYPALGSEKWMGPVTIRRGVTSSLNIVAARTLFEHVTTATSKQYLVNLGIDAARVNADGPGLALGTSGITPVEMAAAYGTIANGGEYITPHAFSRVVDSNGKVILRSEDFKERRQVFKRSTAYMMLDMMQDVVSRGTGTEARIENMTVAGKTGTNENYTSVYFAGATPYYSASLWIGHDKYNNKLRTGSTGGKYAAPLWSAFMGKIHEGLADKPIMDDSPVELGLVKRTVCSVSGLLATEACAADPYHPPVSDWFLDDNVPYDECNMHAYATLCSESGQPASAYCYGTVSGSVVLISSLSPYRQFDPANLLKAMPNAVFTDYTAEQFNSGMYDSSCLCYLHTPWYLGYGDGVSLTSAIQRANELIARVQGYLNVVQTLSKPDRETLEIGISWLNYAIQQKNVSAITSYTEQLEYNYQKISAANPPPA